MEEHIERKSRKNKKTYGEKLMAELYLVKSIEECKKCNKEINVTTECELE